MEAQHIVLMTPGTMLVQAKWHCYPAAGNVTVVWPCITDSWA